MSEGSITWSLVKCKEKKIKSEGKKKEMFSAQHTITEVTNLSLLFF